MPRQLAVCAENSDSSILMMQPADQASQMRIVARKLAVILHRMWIEGSEFKWSSKEAASQPA
jgi:predicted aldo/keto reductase-like oxidoreductase